MQFLLKKLIYHSFTSLFVSVIIFFTFLVVSFVSAQNAIKDDGSNDFSVRVCENEKATFESFTQNRNLHCFEPITNKELSKKKYTDKDRIWLEISVHNPQKKFVIFDNKIDSIKVYQNDSVFLSGVLVTASQKQVQVNSLVNAIQITNFSTPFYVELISSRKIAISSQIELVTQQEFEKEYIKSALRENLFQFFFQGMLWIILLYNFFLFLSSGEKVYLNYVGYLLGVSILSAQNTGILVDYVIPNYPQLSYFFRIVGIAFTFTSYFYFILTFLPVRTLLKFWKRMFIVLAIVEINLALIYEFIAYGFQNVGFYTKIAAVSHGIMLLIALVFLVDLGRKYWSEALVRFFLIGSLVLIMGGLAYNILRFFKESTGIDAYLLAQAAGILEILIFSLGLGYKMKKAEEQHARVLENQNRILEEKVQERTKEITVQNEELHQQQEEIVSQRDQIETQNQKLVHTNKQFTDSVRYAKTIQEAILPIDRKIREYFKESFVLFKPRDIVSGDFYWMHEAKDPFTAEDVILIAVLDCTGHGVPGAFISLIGFAILNEIVDKEQIITPARILEEVDKRLKVALKQQQNANADGMDAALCSIKKLNLEHPSKHFEVIFSGAKRPFYYIHQNELEEIKGTRFSIGGATKRKPVFEDHTRILSKEDKIYLATDGFADQNGSDKKKIGSKKLKETFEELQNFPSVEQKVKLEEILNLHQGKEKQRDDITILGVKL